jgi:tRNA(Ile)-lysidine synthase
VTQSVEHAIAAFEPHFPLAVALSGGADSVALLVACAQKWQHRAGAEGIYAIHVNHNLQSAATQFEAHCRALCEALNVPLIVQSVDANPASGQSPEDAARQARYKAFSAATHSQSAHIAIENVAKITSIASIAIAQHADDQIETLLLALSRGAGLAGLSAMPAQWERDGISYHRPFLPVAGADVRRWLHQQNLPITPPFIEDPTNADARFTRNRIRAQLMPVLREVFPQCLDTFTRSSRHAAEAEGLLQELARDDWQRVGSASGCHIAALQGLSRARQANVLRFWLKTQYATIPSTVQLQELQRQLQACTTRGHRIHLKIGAGFVQRQGRVLVWDTR